jgi:hypothetical protein
VAERPSDNGSSLLPFVTRERPLPRLNTRTGCGLPKVVRFGSICYPLVTLKQGHRGNTIDIAGISVSSALNSSHVGAQNQARNVITYHLFWGLASALAGAGTPVAAPRCALFLVSRLHTPRTGFCYSRLACVCVRARISIRSEIVPYGYNETLCAIVHKVLTARGAAQSPRARAYWYRDFLQFL